MKEVDEMAASLVIEHEVGTWSGQIHPHKGYYAGNFSSAPQQSQRSELPKEQQHCAGHVER
jgi:hypothetical protein